MIYITLNGLFLTESEISFARFLISQFSGRSYEVFDNVNFVNICKIKGTIRDVQVYNRNIPDHIVMNNFAGVFRDVVKSDSFVTDFNKAINLFSRYEDVILGNIQNPRYFQIDGVMFSDTKILAGYELLHGKKKHEIDEEVQAFIKMHKTLLEIPQSHITAEFLLDHNDYYRAFKKREALVGRDEALAYIRNRFEDDFFVF